MRTPSAELNYQTTEKEMLAVVHALRVWRCYLEGAEFTVYTDHVSKTYFQTQPNLSRRQARWSKFLQRFGAFEWKYRKGTKNVADALSRRNVAGSVWHFCRAAQFPVVGTAVHSQWVSPPNADLILGKYFKGGAAKKYMQRACWFIFSKCPYG
jgi:hypothetical protein